MPSRICCPQGHPTKAISLHEAAIALSEGRPFGVCKKCGNGLEYRIEHAYANDPSEKQYRFAVTRTVRLRTPPAGGETIDPFLLVLRNIETGEQQVLPTFWFHGQSNTQRGGQFPPLLTVAEWRGLFGQLDPGFQEIEERIRLRAYELYEQRGKQNGSALADWLQAESELAELPGLSAAA